MSSTILNLNPFISNLNKIDNELAVLDKVSKVDIFNRCIQSKLQETLLRYNIQMDLNSKYIMKHAGLQVLKTVARMKKNVDKEVIEQNMEGNG